MAGPTLYHCDERSVGVQPGPGPDRIGVELVDMDANPPNNLGWHYPKIMAKEIYAGVLSVLTMRFRVWVSFENDNVNGGALTAFNIVRD